jgi:hypothetical protein
MFYFPPSHPIIEVIPPSTPFNTGWRKEENFPERGSGKSYLPHMGGGEESLRGYDPFGRVGIGRKTPAKMGGGGERYKAGWG